MHRSRLAGLIVDCESGDLEAAAAFWSAALGAAVRPASDGDDARYRELDMRSDEPYVEVQQVDHPSRVHIDIETDDVEAEAARLEALGARRVAAVRSWIVMEAPTGQRFCVVPVVSRVFESRANTWDAAREKGGGDDQ